MKFKLIIVTKVIIKNDFFLQIIPNYYTYQPKYIKYLTIMERSHDRSIIVRSKHFSKKNNKLLYLLYA